jgi:hypothetical protein
MSTSSSPDRLDVGAIQSTLGPRGVISPMPAKKKAAKKATKKKK